MLASSENFQYKTSNNDSNFSQLVKKPLMKNILKKCYGEERRTLRRQKAVETEDDKPSKGKSEKRRKNLYLFNYIDLKTSFQQMPP